VTKGAASSAAAVRWDLTPLEPAPGLSVSLREAVRRCSALRARHEGRVGRLDPSGLRALLDELGALWNELSRLSAYASLRYSVAVAGEEEIELATTADLALAEAADLLRFVDLEWLALPDEAVSTALDDPVLAPYCHFLGSKRRFRPHVLSAPEERALVARSAAAEDAWIALYEQTVATAAVPFDDAELTIDELLTRLRDPVRQVRHRALATLAGALHERLPTIAHCYDSLVADRLAVDRMRGFGGPRAVRDLENDLPPAAVDRMLEAIEAAYPIAREWFARKERLLGAPMTVADEHAPLAQAPQLIPFAVAVETIVDVLDRLDPELGSIARGFVDDARIDAEPRPGKSGNALCLSVSHDRDPYLLVNYTDRLSDVLKLAHELGHGVQFSLTRRAQTPLTFEAPVALSEIPSTFTELLVADELVERELDVDLRRALLAERVEASFDAIFRQVALTRYEQAAYELRAAGQPLLADRLCGLWLEANRAYYGSSIALPDDYAPSWAYIAHFFHGRFYNYSYAFAHLTCLLLRARLREEGEAFVGRYVAFLGKGGSQAPVRQLKELGVDIDQDDLWSAAFDELSAMVFQLLQETGDGLRA
jgi:oligoendopeptidase F